MNDMETPSAPQLKPKSLLDETLVVVNVGLEGFADELRQEGVDVTQVDWKPPAGGDPELSDLLSKLGT